MCKAHEATWIGGGGVPGSQALTGEEAWGPKAQFHLTGFVVGRRAAQVSFIACSGKQLGALRESGAQVRREVVEGWSQGLLTFHVFACSVGKVNAVYFLHL